VVVAVEVVPITVQQGVTVAVSIPVVQHDIVIVAQPPAAVHVVIGAHPTTVHTPVAASSTGGNYKIS